MHDPLASEQNPAGQDRTPAHASGRASTERGATAPCELQLSGANPEEAAVRRCQGRVVAKVEWHQGELYPRVGFIVTNLARLTERVVAFYNKRVTCEQ